MASLMDIGPLTETIKIRGINLDVSGVSTKDLFRLITKYPEFREIVSGSSKDITPEKFVNLGSDVVSTIIAMVTGSSGDKNVEEKAKQLSAGEQVEIMSIAFRLTFPGGIGPFVDQLTSLAGSIAPKVIQIEHLTNSQEPSLAAFQADSDLSPHGRKLHVN